MTTKLYPFSIQKHAHDVEYRKNRTYNLMADMESGEIPMDSTRYDRLSRLYDSLSDLLSAVLNSRDGRIAYLTGPQIGLAKETIAWAAEAREDSRKESANEQE